jgi:uncharacterized protein YPO0396
MKLLNKVLLINWYTIIKQTIEFKQINFFTGETGAGKSTIIDALQLLFLGDLRGHYFNKSANVNSERTLRGYLRGELADDESNGFIFLRNFENYPSFTSYIAAEFYDDKKDSHFTIGIVFDNYENGDYDHRYFIFNKKIPSSEFINNELPLNIEDLKKYLKNEYKISDLTFTKTQYEYHSKLLSTLGSINRNFFNLFQKAVPFTPDINIEKFIGEYVCDIKSNIDIEAMKEKFRHYKQIDTETERTKKRILDLERIENLYQEFQEESNTLIEQNYIIDKAEMQKITDDIEKYNNLLLKNDDMIKLRNNDIKYIEEEVPKLEKRKEDKIAEREQTGIDSLRIQADALNSQLSETEQDIKNIERKIHSIGFDWTNNISACKDMLKIYQTDDSMGLYSITEMLYQKCVLLVDYKRDTQYVNKDQLDLVKLDMELYKQKISAMYHNLVNASTEKKEIAQTLSLEIKNLNVGNKPYEDKYMIFKTMLEDELQREFGEKITINMLCEVIDINDISWRNAIEAYLHTQKFDFIVEPKYYIFASKFYEQYGYIKKFFDIGLIDGENLLNDKADITKDSLAEEITTSNIYAKAYTNYLLGRVKKCYDINNIRDGKIAITKSCVLYQNFVTRLLNEKRWRYPFIGKESFEELIRMKTIELEALQNEIQKLDNIINKLGKLIKIEPISEWAIGDIISIEQKKEKLNYCHNQLEEVNKKLHQVDLLYIHRVEQEIDDIKSQLSNYSQQRDRLLLDVNSLEITCNNIRTSLLPDLISRENAARLAIKDNYRNNTCIESFGDEVYDKVMKEYRNPTYLIDQYRYLRVDTIQRKKEKKQILEQYKTSYNEEYHITLDAQSDDNIEYSRELVRLIDTELPMHEQAIKDAKLKAYEQFRDEFISKLQSSIDIVKSQLNDLNLSLKEIPFGKDAYYKFTFTPNPDYKPYYDMITDPLFYTGFYSSSPEILEKYSDTLDSLFKQIIDAADENLDSEMKKNLEKNIKIYTDYRTYLKFDLKVIKENGREESLAKRLLKKSGGETQTPFYICILASFVRTYMMKQNEKYSNTIRLIIFDEAFSKMDHKRIPECVRLLKSFGFQTILSAPSEKIGDIAPIVDKTILVMTSKDITVTKEFDTKEINEIMELY